MTPWSEDYVDTYNALAGMIHGGAATGEVVIAAVILTAFKRLVEWVLLNTPTPQAANPFDLTTPDYVGHSETPGLPQG